RWAVAGTVGLAGDTSRVIAQIVSGIGFLGAGSIIQSRGAVTGMTTAAYVWTTAALGIMAGLDRFALAIASTFLILLVMTVFDRLETYLRSQIHKRYFLRIRYDKARKETLA